MNSAWNADHCTQPLVHNVRWAITLTAGAWLDTPGSASIRTRPLEVNALPAEPCASNVC
jgi:hypothetical protein